MDIRGIGCIVTGGGSGLGLAAAGALAEAGGRVAVMGRRAEPLEAAAAAIGAEPVVGDIADQRSLDAALERCTATLGTPRVLVNCAADMRLLPLLDREGRRTPLAEFEEIVRTNLTGTYAAVQAFAAGLRTAEPIDADGQRGVIVTVSSAGALDGAAGGAAYNASKAGMDALTLALARELAPLGIRVVTIAAGPMATASHDRAVPPHIAAVLERTWVFPRRPGRPNAFASLVLEVVRNDHLNGTIIRLDGGIRAPMFGAPS